MIAPHLTLATGEIMSSESCSTLEGSNEHRVQLKTEQSRNTRLVMSATVAVSAY